MRRCLHILSHLLPWALIECLSSLDVDKCSLVEHHLSLGVGLSVKHFTLTVSHVIHPLTLVDVAISVDHLSFSLSLTGREASLVEVTVWVSHLSLASHVVLHKLTLVFFAVLGKSVNTLSVELTVLEITNITVALELKLG